MRYAKIFLLHLENLLEHRSRSVVWFLVSITTPLLFLLFWSGTFTSHTKTVAGWTLPFFTSYYLLLTVASSLLQSHIEENVAMEDIQQGHLVSYLLKPFSYYWIKFFEEIPYRIFQGFIGIVVFIILFALLGSLSALSLTPTIIFFTIISAVFAILISFTYKMLIGISAFWITDSHGLQQMSEILNYIFAGFIVPISFFPDWLKTISLFTPFPYTLYIPITIIQGILSLQEIFIYLALQITWLIILIFIYIKIWHAGIRKFSAIGQ